MTIASRRPQLSWAPVAVAAGCAVLVLRPLLWRAAGHPTVSAVALFTALLVVGWRWPVEREDEPARASSALVLAVGVGAFAMGRLVGGGHAPLPFAARLVLLNSVAAVAEEAFFRRLVYATLRPAGAGYAIAGSAALFAVVHVTVYGAWVLPIDLAAGLLLSWQRSATGGWAVPAATHVLANVLVVI